jgi:enamine deaminase RidA (YjgF/YER057c/UK114 family)
MAKPGSQPHVNEPGGWLRHVMRAPGQAAHKRGCLHVQSVSSWAPACIGPYAQGTRAMGLVHLAGQIGLDPPTMQLREGPQQAALKEQLRPLRIPRSLAT